MFALTGVDLAAGRILCPNKLWWTTLAANDDDLAQQLVWETTTMDYQLMHWLTTSALPVMHRLNNNKNKNKNNNKNKNKNNNKNKNSTVSRLTC
jgi:hypothetical protein